MTMRSCQLPLVLLTLHTINFISTVSQPPDPCCSTGIIYNQICCAKSCGQCGGDECDGFQGGETNCCPDMIAQHSGTCSKIGPPCIITANCQSEIDINTYYDLSNLNLPREGLANKVKDVDPGRYDEKNGRDGNNYDYDYGYDDRFAPRNPDNPPNTDENRNRGTPRDMSPFRQEIDPNHLPWMYNGRDILVEVTACEGWHYASVPNTLQLQLGGEFQSTRFFYVNKRNALPTYGESYIFYVKVDYYDIYGNLVVVFVNVNDKFGYCMKGISIILLPYFDYDSDNIFDNIDPDGSKGTFDELFPHLVNKTGDEETEGGESNYTDYIEGRYDFYYPHFGMGMFFSKECKYSFVSLTAHRIMPMCNDDYFDLYVGSPKAVYKINPHTCIHPKSGIQVLDQIGNLYHAVMGKIHHENVYIATDIIHMDHVQVGFLDLHELGHIVAGNVMIDEFKNHNTHPILETYHYDYAFYSRNIEGKILGIKLEAIGYNPQGVLYFHEQDTMYFHMKINGYEAYVHSVGVLGYGQYLVAFLDSSDRIIVSKSTQFIIYGDFVNRLFLNIFIIFEGYYHEYKLPWVVEEYYPDKEAYVAPAAAAEAVEAAVAVDAVEPVEAAVAVDAAEPTTKEPTKPPTKSPSKSPTTPTTKPPTTKPTTKPPPTKSPTTSNKKKRTSRFSRRLMGLMEQKNENKNDKNEDWWPEEHKKDFYGLDGDEKHSDNKGSDNKDYNDGEKDYWPPGYDRGYEKETKEPKKYETTEEPVEEEEEKGGHKRWNGISWFLANQYCHEDYGTYLASIHSSDEEFLMNGFIGTYPGDRAWIGLFDFDINNPNGCHGFYGSFNMENNDDGGYYRYNCDWKWIDRSYVDYTDWSDYSPNHLSGNDCAFIDGHHRRGWENINCESRDFVTKYVCLAGWWYPNHLRKFNHVTDEQIKGNPDTIVILSLGNDSPVEPVCFDTATVDGITQIDTSVNWIGGPNPNKYMTVIYRLPICKTEVIRMDVDYSTSITRTVKEAWAVPTLFCYNEGRMGQMAECYVDQFYSITENTKFRVGDHYEGLDYLSWASESAVTLSTSQSKSFHTTNLFDFKKKYVIWYVDHGPNGTYNLNNWKQLVVKPENTFTNIYEDVKYETYNGYNLSFFTTQIWERRITLPMHCFGEAYIPSSHVLPYQSIVSTLTMRVNVRADLKLKICEEFINEKAFNEDDAFVYIDDVPAQLTHWEPIGCALRWYAAEYIPNTITCEEEQQLAISLRLTYLPRCNNENSKLYDGCQCNLGRGVCWCVTPQGDKINGQAAQIPPSYTYHEACVSILNCSNSQVTLN